MTSVAVGHAVVVATSTRADGAMRRDLSARSAWLHGLGAPMRHCCPEQVHGTRIVTAATGTSPEADGLVTTDPGLALGVWGADCPGLVVACPDALGVAHCGWRGTAGGIVAQLMAELADLSSHPPSTWQAFIGPAICGACYEVDGPVLDAYDWDPAGLRPGREGHAWLDVAATVRRDCLRVGITQVERSPICTAENAAFHSYRMAGAGPSQLLLAWRRQP